MHWRQLISNAATGSINRMIIVRSFVALNIKDKWLLPLLLLLWTQAYVWEINISSFSSLDHILSKTQKATKKVVHRRLKTISKLDFSCLSGFFFLKTQNLCIVYYTPFSISSNTVIYFSCTENIYVPLTLVTSYYFLSSLSREWPGRIKAIWFQFCATKVSKNAVVFIVGHQKFEFDKLLRARFDVCTSIEQLVFQRYNGRDNRVRSAYVALSLLKGNNATEITRNINILFGNRILYLTMVDCGAECFEMSKEVKAEAAIEIANVLKVVF